MGDSTMNKNNNIKDKVSLLRTKAAQNRQKRLEDQD